jgi:hypothetical protein
MADYRLYCLDGAGRIGSGEWIEAESDEAAIALVKAKKLNVSCEIWDRGRPVAMVAPYRP